MSREELLSGCRRICLFQIFDYRQRISQVDRMRRISLIDNRWKSVMWRSIGFNSCWGYPKRLASCFYGCGRAPLSPVLEFFVVERQPEIQPALSNVIIISWRILSYRTFHVLGEVGTDNAVRISYKMMSVGIAG